MRWIASTASILCAVLSCATRAEAQLAEGQLLREGANFSPQEINPERDLVLYPRRTYVHSGVTISLANGQYFEPISIPLGLSYGIIDDLEAGGELNVLFNRPSPLSSVALGSPRLYGRYQLVKRLLAVEGSVAIPVGKAGDRLGFRIETPLRVSFTDDIKLMGAATYAGYFGSSEVTEPFVDFAQIGATGIFRVAPGIWGAVELGLTLKDFDFDNPFVPFGISGGYEITDGLLILPGFRFPDITTPAFRSFQLLVVYTWDFYAPASEDETETPDIPL